MTIRYAFFIATLVVAIPSYGKTPTTKLSCGQAVSYQVEAERQFLSAQAGGGDSYTLNVTYITKKPDTKTVDKALRDCLAVASKQDGTKDILATGWFRPK